jgi:hypothetical protein
MALLLASRARSARVSLQERTMTKPTIDKRTAVVLMGVFAATLTDAIAGSTLSFIRFDMMGDVYASADEAAIFDYGYTAAKIVGVIFAAWVSSAQPLGRSSMRR